MRGKTMNYKTYRTWCGILGGIMGAIFSISIIIGNWIIPVITVVTGIIILTILRRRVTEIVTDERTFSVAGKAARLTMQITIYAMTIIGVIIIAMNFNRSSTLIQVGLAFEYAVCALLIINSLAYTYYNRKLGGKP
jgi:uncharacterized membrane protein